MSDGDLLPQGREKRGELQSAGAVLLILMYPLVYPLVYPLLYPLVYLLVYPLLYPLVYPLVCPLLYPLVYLLVYPLVYPLVCRCHHPKGSSLILLVHLYFLWNKMPCIVTFDITITLTYVEP